MTGTVKNNCVGCGIDLAVECAYLGQWSNPLAMNAGVTIPVGKPAIPPSALVPRFNEPIRTDIFWPPHPRGSGQDWPPEAHVSKTSLCGRLPMAYAWALLQHDKQWVWSDDADRTPVAGADAICAVVKDACSRMITDVQQPPVVLVIPNGLSESHRQSLIATGDAEGLKIKLLWRPVAAALSWCNINSRKLQERPHEVGNTMGRILVLHMGFDVFEATILDVVPSTERGETWFLPARHRPNRQHDAIESFGYDLLFSFTNECLQSENRTPTTSAIWERMWCTSWLRTVIGSLVGGNAEASSQYATQVQPAITSEAWSEIWHSQLDRISQTCVTDNPVDGDLGGHLCGGFDISSLTKWQNHCSNNIRKAPLLGAVATGPLASTPVNQHETYGRMLLRKLGCPLEIATVEGEGLPFGILAEGAACYSSRRYADLPTYLDTLPRIQTVIRRQGEPTWIDLLSSDESFVDGGRIWRRPKNVDNLEIQESQKELTLAVNHEEYPYVRAVTADLPKELEEKQPVSLAVAIEPAQGNARIEVVPEDANLFGRSRIIVNWKSMGVFIDKEDGCKKTPEEYLESFPRYYPPLSKRKHSIYRWRAIQNNIQDVTRRVLDHPSANWTHEKIEKLLEVIKQKDSDYYPQDATAISSDGKVSNNQEVLESFVEAMCVALSEFSGRRAEVCIRTLGYTSTDNPTFREIILSGVEEFLASRYRDGLGQHILTSCGWCLREPEDIQLFAKACEKHMRRNETNLMVWLKAFSEILRYRDDATRNIDTPLAQYLIEKSLATFITQRKRNNGNFLFRYSCLIIVYLLRRRAYDNNFLPPESDLAERVKDEFRTAIEAYNNHTFKLIGGAVNLAAALQTMIDYIDLRGRGSILLGVD